VSDIESLVSRTASQQLSTKDDANRLTRRRVDDAVPPQPERTAYIGGRESERQSATNSSMTAVPAHMTVSAPPQ